MSTTASNNEYIHVPYTRLRDAAAEIGAVCEDLRFRFDTITAIVHRLQGVWDTDASEVICPLDAADLREYTQTVEELRTLPVMLTRIADAYQSAENDNTAVAEQLPNGVVDHL